MQHREQQITLAGSLPSADGGSERSIISEEISHPARAAASTAAPKARRAACRMACVRDRSKVIEYRFGFRTRRDPKDMAMNDSPRPEIKLPDPAEFARIMNRIAEQSQRLIADQLYWINVTGYPFFQAYRNQVKNYPFYNQAYFFLEQVWLENNY